MECENLIRPVSGFEGYFVARCGCVYGPKGILASSRVTNKGYVIYTLCRGDDRKQITGHRLVVISFLGEIPDGMQVNHINGNKTDNRLDNLEVVTQCENMAHAVKTGLIKGAKVVGRHKDGTVKIFMSMSAAAKEVGTTRQHIRKFAEGLYSSDHKYDRNGWSWSYAR